MRKGFGKAANIHDTLPNLHISQEHLCPFYKCMGNVNKKSRLKLPLQWTHKLRLENT